MEKTKTVEKNLSQLFALGVGCLRAVYFNQNHHIHDEVSNEESKYEIQRQIPV